MGRPADLGDSEDGSPVGRGEDRRREHIPVLTERVVEKLAVHPDSGRYLDATVGGGGHAAAILEASGPGGRVLGLDRDEEAAVRARSRLRSFGERVTIVQASYVALLDVARREGFYPLDGVLFDLGFSSFQIEEPCRGFSFGLPGPLDMRYDAGSGATAAELVNQLPESKLVEVLFDYGEEPRSRQIARAIVKARPIETTIQLADVVVGAVGGRRGAIHPATRTFQALRIAVNDELSGLETALPDAVTALRSGGRLAVISFHSLEDRIVKHFMQQESRDCICPPEVPVCQCHHVRTLHLITRGPIVPSDDEVTANPRSRSAKLRVAEKV